MARTWSVEQDGSGDWVTIQAAFEASASGDTILIGPGVYNQTHDDPYSNPVVAYLGDHKDLVVSGVSKDEVFIGPDVFTVDCTGLYFSEGTAEVSNLTFQNCFDALKGSGDFIIQDCKLLDCGNGLISVGAGRVEISSCQFGPDPTGDRNGAINVWSAGYVSVIDCTMTDCKTYLDNVSDSQVKGCQFDHSLVSRSVVYMSSSGVFEDNQSNGVLEAGGTVNLAIRNSVFYNNESEEYNLALQGDGVNVEIFDSFFYGGTWSSLYLLSEASVRGEGNHFLNRGGHSVRLKYYGQYDNNAVVDLRNNYWGTADSTQIADWIYDSNDTSTIYTEVQFNPFSDVPLPAEKKSLGSFKSLYR